MTAVPRIRSIITTRYRSNWPTWQMVHEWEDILAKILAVPIRAFGETCMLPDPYCLQNNYDLLFLQLASELRYYEENRQLIPIVMDLWRDDFSDFLTIAPRFRLIFVTNLQAYEELSPRLSNLRYLPFSLADQYLNLPVPTKDIDIIQYGRRNPLLDQFMDQLLVNHPEIHYVTTDSFDQGKTIHIHSNTCGDMGESDSRRTFMTLLDRCKISLVSTVGMDGSRATGGIDPVSPRFLESMAAGCHLVGRIPDNKEFRTTGIAEVCHHVTSYQQFEQLVCTLLSQSDPPSSTYHLILQERLTSALPARIINALRSLNGSTQALPTAEELMQHTKPVHDLICRLHAVQQLSETIPASVAFTNYLTLCNVIASYREFHQLDLSYLYTEILKGLVSNDMVLLINALELAGMGTLDAALTIARRAVSLNPANQQAAFLSADLLRRCGHRTEARLACLEILKKWPDFDEAKAVQDMCDIDDVLPLPKEHYHLLHAAHCLLRPRRYVEIGVSNGKSLSLTQQGSSALGVDPLTGAVDHLFFHSLNETPTLFKLTSNEFFQNGCMEKAWGTHPFDMAFIDGLHLFEQALMDFIHLEQRSSPDSVIFIHDCLPVNRTGAERERTTMVWTGDVWKVIHCLKQVRPDLEIITFPARPSGLAMVRRLDSSSKLLSTQFDALVAHFLDAQLPEDLSERFRLLNVTDQPYEAILSAIRPYQNLQTGEGAAA